MKIYFSHQPLPYENDNGFSKKIIIVLTNGTAFDQDVLH